MKTAHEDLIYGVATTTAPGSGPGPAPYDAIARQYQRTKASPVRRYLEAYTLGVLLGDVAGLTLLDVGCGEGFHARRVRADGAARVVGADLSAAMIDLARDEERRAPLGIDYHCCDAADLPVFGAFDAVLAAYLLHYAPDADVIARICARLAANLRPGGRLVALIENPGQAVSEYPGYDQYGFNKTAAEPRAEGSRITYTLVAGREMIRFDVFWYGRATYERALLDAGFTAIAWHRPRLDPAAGQSAYWREYLDNPPVLGLTATRTELP